MKKKEFEKLERRFYKYYRSFDQDNNDIYVKFVHSYHVMHYMEKLARKLNLSEGEVYLAKAIGLLHDIGRFEQLQSTSSYDDLILNHADVAVEYLFTNNHIREYIDNPEYDEIIKKAIQNHNRKAIDPELKDDELLFARMIRDMDKVDIYNQDASFYKNEFIKPPTKKVLEDFYEGRLIDDKDSNNNSDLVIRYFAFLNDINFKESLDILRESDNLTIYINSIKVSTENERLFQELVNECEKRLDNSSNKVNVKENNNGRIE